MKVTMVARDLAPSRALEMVRQKLSERGIEVSAHLGGGKPLVSSSDQIESDVQNSNLLFLGMSCSPELAKEEIGATKVAVEHGVRFGFYADLFGTSSRTFFTPFRGQTSFVFVISEEEAKSTRRLFPNAEVVPSGNPVLEGAFTVLKSNAEVRALFGLEEKDLLMYCTAGKDLEVNRLHFRAVVEAVSLLCTKERWKIFFMLHPGDQNPPSAYEDFIQTEGIWVRLISSKDVKVKGLASLDLISACDLMIAAVSTSGIEAACLRKPVIDFFSEPGLKRMREQTGYEVWPPVAFGVSRAAHNCQELACAIDDLMSSGFNAMRVRQEACFPKPATADAAVKSMTDTIMKILNS